MRRSMKERKAVILGRATTFASGRYGTLDRKQYGVKPVTQPDPVSAFISRSDLFSRLDAWLSERGSA